MTNIIKPHNQFKIEFLDVPEFKRTLKGVYRIENFYVGASKNIRRRIISHCLLAYNPTNIKYDDKPLLKAIRVCFASKGFISVTILDTDPKNEIKYIDYNNMFNKPNGVCYHQFKETLLK
jgi:hypothetical protein